MHVRLLYANKVQFSSVQFGVTKYKTATQFCIVQFVFVTELQNNKTIDVLPLKKKLSTFH